MRMKLHYTRCISLRVLLTAVFLPLYLFFIYYFIISYLLHTRIFRFRVVIYYIHAIRYTLALFTNTFYLYLNANVYFKSCITFKT